MSHTDLVVISSEALGESKRSGCGGGALAQVCTENGARMTATGIFQRPEHSLILEKIRTHLYQGTGGGGRKSGGIFGRLDGKT